MNRDVIPSMIFVAMIATTLASSGITWESYSLIIGSFGLGIIFADLIHIYAEWRVKTLRRR
jgi:hypothetical protein